jgi:hypothetical protein
MQMRFGLYGLSALLACSLLAAPAQALDMKVKLGCTVMHGVIMTNTSSYQLPKGARVDIVLRIGAQRQRLRMQLAAFVPAGAVFNYGPIILPANPASPMTCVAEASWRTFVDTYVKP